MIAMTTRSEDGLVWKAIDNESQKRGDASTDGKKIKVDHTYLFVKQSKKCHHLLENLVKPF